MIPYLVMTFLYIMVAVLMALESSFSSLSLLPWFNGMVWLRVHFITLGVLTQIIFGVTPILTAKHYGQPRPAIQWDVWATLNVGIILLLIGIPLISATPIIVGGTLVFISTVLLGIQLSRMRPAANHHSPGRKFYLAGLAYFLLGILVGSGLFLGWAKPLQIVGNATEVHIHANNWGLMSLIFAGLLVDLYPTWAKRPFRQAQDKPLRQAQDTPFANPKSITPIFWMMTLGAFGLIFGPWFEIKWFLLVPGLVLHLAATIWLLYNVIQPLRGHKEAQTIGIKHLIMSYFWLLMPILMAPFVLFGVGELPTATIEKMAPQALIYGWVLQFGIAIVPYFFQRFLFNEENAELGGTKASFILVNLGSLVLWVSIFSEAIQGTLHGIAYLLWAGALITVAVNLWSKMKKGITD
jgi:hypothetical protein